MCCKRWMTGVAFWKVEEGKKKFSATILCKVMADTSWNIVAKTQKLKHMFQEMISLELEHEFLTQACKQLSINNFYRFLH